MGSSHWNLLAYFYLTIDNYRQLYTLVSIPELGSDDEIEPSVFPSHEWSTSGSMEFLCFMRM